MLSCLTDTKMNLTFNITKVKMLNVKLPNEREDEFNI